MKEEIKKPKRTRTRIKTKTPLGQWICDKTGVLSYLKKPCKGCAVTCTLFHRVYSSTRVTPEDKAFIFARDKKCLCCGTTEDLTIDHIIPVSINNDNSVANLQLLCLNCNHIKGTDIIDYRMTKHFYNEKEAKQSITNKIDTQVWGLAKLKAEETTTNSLEETYWDQVVNFYNELISTPNLFPIEDDVPFTGFSGTVHESPKAKTILEIATEQEIDKNNSVPYDYIKPSHYAIWNDNTDALKVIELVLNHLNLPPYESALLFNILKYQLRVGKKPGIPVEEDINKVKEYTEILNNYRNGRVSS